ncbi:MAG TPA: GFA family protein [Polyangia bacterium]|nr:GFA family protein [Polyangia bacterium]
MSQNATYEGRCFCGAVELTVTGAPEAMGYCHCASCRKWSAGPVNAFSLWKADSVAITKGADRVGTFNRTDNSFRKWCTVCGGHLMNQHPRWGLIDVYAATIPGLPFKPGLHVNYQETVLPMNDGLPKLRDLPKELGGTAEPMPA